MNHKRGEIHGMFKEIEYLNILDIRICNLRLMHS